MYSLLTTFGERKNTIFLLLFLKESINQILASNKDFMVYFWGDIFILIWKKYHTGGPAERKIKLVWPYFSFFNFKFSKCVHLYFVFHIEKAWVMEEKIGMSDVNKKLKICWKIYFFPIILFYVIRSPSWSYPRNTNRQSSYQRK